MGYSVVIYRLTLLSRFVILIDSLFTRTRKDIIEAFLYFSKKYLFLKDFETFK